ncbi:AAA domain-containing protein [Naumannella sp. ID2617S]|nr:AAA domain-containing protein [Naumannella sp. ID2617S]
MGQPDLSGDSFSAKLAKQLDGASDNAILLFAELTYLCVLPLSDYRSTTKRSVVSSVLSRMQVPVELPPQFEAALTDKAFNGGVAFKTRRYFQLAFLCEFARAFVEVPLDDPAWQDPIAFREHLAAVTNTYAPSQKHSLLYLAFPEFFLPVVSDDHRRRILATFGDAIPQRSGDDDQDLRLILSQLELNAAHELYVEPWLSRWHPPSTAHPNSQHLWLVRGAAVDGTNLIPVWLEHGYVSVRASGLRPINEGVASQGLKEIVANDLPDLSYAAKAMKVDTLHRFLTLIQEGDVVVAVDQSRFFVGRVTGGIIRDDAAGSLTTLRREVTWNADPGDVAELPGDARARLKVNADVVDLTSHAEAFLPLAPTDDGTDDIPDPVPTPIRELTLPDATDELAQRLHVDRAWLQECIELLREKPQLIFYGPPGTGKTYIARALAEHLAGENVRLVQFHPAYSYEDFFEGYRPVESGGFALRPGPLRKVVDKARENPATAYFLIIDEINRGNLAKIFGELYFLLEYRDENVDLLYATDDDEGFTLPTNVFLIGTMNTADRSIALVDAAMRRRFSFVPLHPSEAPTADVLRRWLKSHNHQSQAADLLDALNARIDDPDFKVGPSYFMGGQTPTPQRVARVWRTAILPLLEEHHYGDGIDVRQRYGLDVIQQAIQPTGPTDGSDDTH